MQSLPDYLFPLFWDVDVKKFYPAKFPEYTVSRILEFGDERAVSWMKEFYSFDQIVDVIKSDHRLTSKSANFWALIYNISKREVATLKKEDIKRL